MKITAHYSQEGKFIIQLTDDESKPLGYFVATDFRLIKSLKKNNLNNVRLVFEYDKKS